MSRLIGVLLNRIGGLLNPSQKRWIKRVVNPSILEKWIRISQGSSMRGQVETLRMKMLNLGFVQRGYEDLQKIVREAEDRNLVRAAAQELALWHANQYTEADAKICLDYLSVAEKGTLDPALKRQIAIMRAESHQLLGQIDEARAIIHDALEKGAHADLYLAVANLEESPDDKITWINRALRLCGADEIALDVSRGERLYDCLKAGGQARSVHPVPLVTVIMPVYNAEGTVRIALESVLNQTWTNLEVLMVDDCSTDATMRVLREYERRDPRVRVLKANRNGGPYVARNLALREARGMFVTCHDADDWSHPGKIERQVLHLLNHPKAIGNMSEQVRATNELRFYRRGGFGKYVLPNMSSFMFRREPVMEAIGYWDSVRFGADSEFIRRIRKWFGSKAVVELPTGPMSFQRQSAGSLTAHSAFGYQGHFMGARREYFEIYSEYHRNAQSLKYEFPQRGRPFPVPEPMLPDREKRDGGRRHFDVIIASDFRLDGGSTLSSVEEIKAQKRFGLRTGLVQMYRYDYASTRKKINPKIREQVDGEQVQMLVYGEKVSCDVLILRYPPILQEKQIYIPDIEAKRICVIVNQTPMSHYGPDGIWRYRLEQAARHLREYFGKDGTWYPIGPLVREALHRHHADELHAIHLADDDWVNIIDVQQWRRPERPPRCGKIRIGRHSRGMAMKWPADPGQLLQIYPDSDPFEVHVLGGADAPRAMLGRLPSNWRVLEFGEMEPRDFLAQLDVFVYYTHPGLVESFGRVIIEAMAVGVPVILPHQYEPLFGKAAIYAEPHQVIDIIRRLMDNEQGYMHQVQMAWEYVGNNFGYQKHYDRIMCTVS